MVVCRLIIPDEMITFCYYISDYGYGHATRSIALIRALLQQVPESRIVVKSDGPCTLLMQSLPDPRISVIRCRNDIDVTLMPDAPVVNRKLTYIDLVSWMNSWDMYIKKELQHCSSHNVDAIISDIAPQPFLISEALRIPGIAVSNFSWDTIYHYLFPESNYIVNMRSAYHAASLAYILPFQTSMDVFSHQMEAGLLVREKQVSRSGMRHRYQIPESEMLVYLGAGKGLPVHHVREILSKAPPGIRFLVPSGTVPSSSQVLQIPSHETESQNWIEMCDLVVTKCGYSTVSEAVQAKVPLLVWKREGFIEDEAIANYLERLGIGSAISYIDLCSGSWLYDILEIREKTASFDMLSHRYQNNTNTIAAGILEFIA